MQNDIRFSSSRQRKSFIKRNPEFASIEAFANYLSDNGRVEFSGEEMLLLSGAHCVSFTKVRTELEELGFALEHRQIERRIRGFKSRDDDRWDGPGSSATHGGSGFDNRE